MFPEKWKNIPRTGPDSIMRAKTLSASDSRDSANANSPHTKQLEEPSGPIHAPLAAPRKHEQIGMIPPDSPWRRDCQPADQRLHSAAPVRADLRTASIWFLLFRDGPAATLKKTAGRSPVRQTQRTTCINLPVSSQGCTQPSAPARPGTGARRQNARGSLDRRAQLSGRKGTRLVAAVNPARIKVRRRTGVRTGRNRPSR